MTIKVQTAGTQIDGARDYQEDAFLITNLTDAKGRNGALIIVADGMGGHAAGNVASNMAVQAFNKHFSKNYPADDLSEILNESVLKANASLTETIKETAALDGMGCTMVSAIIEEDKLWWASVGDSHLYLLRDKELIKLNENHSYGGFLDRMKEAGTPVDAEKGLSRNMLMSALTGSDIAEVDCPLSPYILRHADRLVICSDGLDTLSEGKIIQYTTWSDTPKECAEDLLNAVTELNVPKQDNTTVVVLLVTDDAIANKSLPSYEEERDKSDITQPKSGGNNTLEDTMPDPRAPIHLAANQDKKSKAGLFISIILILCIAGGGYFIYSNPALQNTIVQLYKKQTTADQEVVLEDIVEETAETAEIAEIAETIAISDTEPDKKSDIKPSVAAKPKAEKKPVAKKVVEKAAKKAADKNIFQDSLKVGGLAPKMIKVPANSFLMGNTATSRFSEERPRHKVDITAFAVSQYEITFKEYDAFIKATGKKAPRGHAPNDKNHPVFNVTWDDANNYTKWLTKQTGKKYRLLSESEWEYMAKAGSVSTFWWGSERGKDHAHCFGCESDYDPRKPTKIGSFKPNNFNIYDTSGNVAEWVKDCWHANYRDAPTTNEVWEGGDCKFRIVRGGGYSSPTQSIRNTKRDKLTSNRPYDHVGIRVAREIE